MTATSSGNTQTSPTFTIGVNQDVTEDELKVTDMVIVIAVSSIVMAGFAGYLYKIDAERWGGKHQISKQQFLIVSTSFADFTSDGAWAYKVINQKLGSRITRTGLARTG